jgi:FemAB-related protein (PEP-CTERM system-associated)
VSDVAASSLTVTTRWGIPDGVLRSRWGQLLEQLDERSPSRCLEWLTILEAGLGHKPLVLEVSSDGETRGMLPLVCMRSALFGRFLVGLPYLNLGGVVATDDDAAERLISKAVSLADDLDVRYLELRHAARKRHPALNYELTEKVHMRLDLPESSDELWKEFSPKVRNQIRKAEHEHVMIEWGGQELLRSFYNVFCHNMRDLGTPVFGRRLFANILGHLSGRAEICIARHSGRAVAGAILVHGDGISEVPSASSLRSANHLNCNMLMYWHLLRRSIERGQPTFDFGRSSAGSNTYRFKAQWGALPHSANWQYYVRRGDVSTMRPENAKNQRRIEAWKRLPIWLTRLAGPAIVRGIP